MSEDTQPSVKERLRRGDLQVSNREVLEAFAIDPDYDPYSVPIDKMDPGHPALFQNDTLWSHFERLRTEDPVHLTEDSMFGPYWSVTKYKDIMYVDTHHKIFSSKERLGGIALGEITHRVAATIRDEQATGSGRILRELAATLVDPVAGVNRLIRGEWNRVGDNPAEHDPGAFLFRLGVGVRGIQDDTTRVQTWSPMIQLDVRYGDPFTRDYRAPFDVFWLRAQVAPGGGGLNLIEGSGRLYQRALDHGGGTRHALMLNHRYEYLHKPVYQYGAQSVEMGLLSRWRLSERSRLRTRLSGDLIVMGAIDAPVAGFGERTYDFGPGAGATLELVLERNGRPAVTLNNRVEYLHTVSGAPANHIVAFSSLEGHVTLGRSLGVGVEFTGATRESRYLDAPAAVNSFGEARLFLSLTSFSGPRTLP